MTSMCSSHRLNAEIFKHMDARKKEIRVEHLARLNSHKMHTVCLLMNARVRNKWINDELLHVCAST